MALLPVLNVDYLDDEQKIYECQIRQLQYAPLTPEIITLLKRKIGDYRGDPTQLIYVDSPEGLESELNRCVMGVRSILSRYALMTHSQKIHQSLHYYYRLRRLSDVQDTERRDKFINRAYQMIEVIQATHPKDPVPELLADWIDVTPETETSTDATNATNAGAIPKTTSQDKQSSMPTQEPDFHSTRHESPHLVEELMKSMSEMRDRMAEENRQQMKAFQKSMMESIQQQLKPIADNMNNPIVQPLIPPPMNPIYVPPANPTQENRNYSDGRRNHYPMNQQRNIPVNMNRNIPTNHPSQMNYGHSSMNPIYQPFHPNPNSTYSTDPTLSFKLQQLPRWRCRFNGNDKPTSDGKNQSLNEYMASVYNFMQTMEVSSRDMMRHIYPTLVDEALHFYNTLDVTNMSIDELFDILRLRFGDKREPAEAILELSHQKFDERSRSIHAHIDDLIFKMNMLSYGWSETEKVAIIKKTLPDSYLRPMIYRGITSLEGMKEFCREAFPIRQSIRARSDRYESRGRVMTVGVTTDDELETEEELDEQNCSVVRKFDPKNNFRRSDKVQQNSQRFDKSEHHRKNQVIESTQKKNDLFCSNCLTLGHASTSCNAPKRVYCFHCGTLGVTVITCESDICRKAKNE